jgi:hypothetical protein
MRHGSIAIPTLLVLLIGCTGRNPAPLSRGPMAQPLVFQLQQQDDTLQNQRIRTLLDFEHEGDFVFATSSAPAEPSRQAHTGQTALRFGGRSVSFRVHSILFSTPFPGDWTLLGAYVQPQVDSPVRVELLDGDQLIADTRNTIQAGRWSFVGIDIAQHREAIEASPDKRYTLRLTLETAGGLASAMVDNVVLIDNARTLLDTRDAGPTGWLIARRGYTTTIDAPGRFKIDLRAAAASDAGWVLSEYSATRAILNSAGNIKRWVVYSDGRYIEDGRMTVKGASGAALIASHESPAIIEPDEATAQLRIHTPGDADNDGYNELNGAYQLTARAPRVQFAVRPQNAECVAPVFEIIDLPDGDVTAMVEGRLLDTAERLADGRVLLKLPLNIDRKMNVTVRSMPHP